jgi:hypothetical protein
MVVEDEAELAALVGSYLERDGFEVTIAGEGPAAVTLAREVDPDVIVLDLGLPGLDGVEVCREVRRLRRHADRPQRRGRQADRPLGRRRRLHDQALQPARARRPHPGDAAPTTTSREPNRNAGRTPHRRFVDDRPGRSRRVAG